MKDIAIGYIRVSTEEQQREGISLDMQMEKLRLYCQMKNLHLAGIYGDPGISGKRMDTRPGVQAVMSMARNKRIDHVVVYKLDRLARNAREALEFADVLKEKGVGLHSITEQVDTHSATGRMFYTFLAGMAAWEREIISERTRAALQSKKANGGRVSRHAPLGYEFNGDSVIENYDEQEAREIARDLTEVGLSLRKVARVLKSQGHVNRNGRAFSPSSVKAMIREHEDRSGLLGGNTTTPSSVGPKDEANATCRGFSGFVGPTSSQN
jgi:DNA invertase Pin-like site-specific DNA recombinase